eukprot:13520671-Ditylum_brightwellii.AAC.1
MASFLVGRLATAIVRALNKSIANNILDALVAQGDRQVLEVAHCVHVAVALIDLVFDLAFDLFFDLFFEEHIEILDLFACQAAPFGMPFGVLGKPDLSEPLLFRDMVHGLNMLPAALHKVALIRTM